MITDQDMLNYSLGRKNRSLADPDDYYIRRAIEDRRRRCVRTNRARNVFERVLQLQIDELVYDALSVATASDAQDEERGLEAFGPDATTGPPATEGWGNEDPSLATATRMTEMSDRLQELRETGAPLRHRTGIANLAYSMLRSRTEADDAVAARLRAEMEIVRDAERSQQ